MATPSVAVEPIFGKKFTNQLGGMANEAAAGAVSAFARRQMAKMGWTEGKGLGKEEQGVVTHVRVQKREEFMGVGVEKLKVEEQKNQWWYNAYDKIADKIKIAADSDDDERGGDAKKKSKKKSKKAKKKAEKKRKREAEEAAAPLGGEKKFRIPTDEELFAATGGKLFGRRAYGSCSGKLKRDELLQSGKFELQKKKSSTSSTSSDDDNDDATRRKRKVKKAKKQQQSETAADDASASVE